MSTNTEKKKSIDILGREEEVETLQQMYESNKPEFLALYGRRRVGKTFLIRQFFKDKKGLFFNVTGTKNGTFVEQLAHFGDQVGKTFYNGAALATPKTWDAAFKLLTNTLEKVQAKKIVLFFDEIPWMATRRSRLLQNLDYYWNQYWSSDVRIKLIICGSSASWIINKIINNKGGLHNRITKKICLEPFNLQETKAYLNSLGIQIKNQQILLLYLVTGGVAYYLSSVEKGLSAAQLIEKIAFNEKSMLFSEFDNLFSSLFDHADICIQIIQ
ncbi:MAG: ATP-binding protein, partial [Candidatus Gribaldobacteria bacterium]|nr:ATP-binding protein [Candidatus Gribaldobacteria bacterium]